MTRKRQKGLVSWGRILAIVVVTIGVFLIVDFGRRAWDNYRLSQEVAALEKEVVAMRAENEALQERLEYVASEAYTEEAAREKLHWVQPGDTAVIVLGAEEESPEAIPIPQEAPEKANWQKWRDLLLGF